VANKTRQVHNEKRRVIEETVRASGLEEKWVAWFLEQIDSLEGARRSAFSGPEGEAKRRYPGEAKAHYLLSYLASKGTKQRESLLASLKLLQILEAKGRDLKAGTFTRSIRLVYPFLMSAIKTSKRSKVVDIHEAGLVVQPTTPASKAALAILLLAEQRKLGRIRRCLHCHAWFYARFKHQKFCNDANKNCQFDHYHTSEWRKQHREQNRRHQAEFRARTFGKRRS
jgi:hypothetical protein